VLSIWKDELDEPGIGARWSPRSCIPHAAAVRCGFACLREFSHLREILPDLWISDREAIAANFRKHEAAVFRARGRIALFPMSSSVVPPKMLRFPSFAVAGRSRRARCFRCRASCAPTADHASIHSSDRSEFHRSGLFHGPGVAKSRFHGLRHALRHELRPRDLAADGVAACRFQRRSAMGPPACRDGLLWHDGERVLARDCVASIRRWAARDGFGAKLMAATGRIVAGRMIAPSAFRLSGPFHTCSPRPLASPRSRRAS